MANCNHKCNCNCNSKKIENLTLDDGRKAQRHVTVDEDGNEVIEIFAEEKRPLKLEKKIVREMKQVVAKEVHETIKDGEIVAQEIHGLEPEVPLQILSRIGVADHAKLIDGEYMKRDEVQAMVTEGVVAGVQALMAHKETMNKNPEPLFKAQSAVENNVIEKKKKENWTVVALGGIMLVQFVAIAYFLFM